ncbi:MAG: response regulator [Bacteroidetes bacterium]|nr:response regulator [Bacteroidota bacterium]
MTTESSRKRILLVEDDEQSVRYIELLLRKRYEVCSTTWAEAAWTLLHEIPIDLVLMDISLPGGVNGLQLTERIRASERLHGLPVIAVTAHAFPRDRVNSLAAGCNEYISKPFEREELLNAVHRFIS